MQNRRTMNMQKLVYVGLLTWTLVAAMHLKWALAQPLLEQATFLACLIGFIVAFWLGTRDSCKGTVEIALLVAQSVFALGTVALDPRGFTTILLVIVAGQLGALPIKQTLLWIFAQSTILYFLYPEHAVSMAIAYSTFQLFGAFTARIAVEERAGRQALAEANAELRVATGLLDMSSRAEERVRIAREIHDLLGHHLTALSLNLEVARHLAEGEAREQIAKSQAITKLLLSDVRDSVSRLREDEPVNLVSALHSIRDVVPLPAIHVEADEIGGVDSVVAGTALRVVQEIVTNAVRHSGARNLWLTLATQQGALAIDARDDGSGTDHVQFGNGLRGMRERVQQAGGTMDVKSARSHGFEVHITLPT
ncbi:MAG TPA: sensor histidine kinase [Thermoanaerobaculia bacterium]|nr:sensor histidine kinase [Thermoanaerobaculia bacterium]